MTIQKETQFRTRSTDIAMVNEATVRMHAYQPYTYSTQYQR